MPWWNVGQMSADDLKAILAYLRSLKPVRNRVDKDGRHMFGMLCGKRLGRRGSELSVPTQDADPSGPPRGVLVDGSPPIVGAGRVARGGQEKAGGGRPPQTSPAI